MHIYNRILFLTALFTTSFAVENIEPLKSFEGPWSVRNVSQNAVPIIGECPSIEVEPKGTGIEGVVMLTTTMKTFTMNVITIDYETYQLSILSDNISIPIGNLSFIHAEQRSFVITQLETEDQIYYAVLIKPDDLSPETDQKIDKTWKSSTTAKNVSLAPVEYEDCPDYEIETGSYEYSAETSSAEEYMTSIIDMRTKTKYDGRDRQKNVTGKTENTPHSAESPTAALPISSDKATLTEETLPIVGENGTNIQRGSAANKFSAQYSTIISVLFYLLVNYLFIE